MPSTNGHGPKRAILYARVSTDEQAKSGYLLRQQMERLREYAALEGYEVLEEVEDPGQSGASLERPGVDRVRDLVSAGGAAVVLAQDRDRFAREPAYLFYLREEFAERGTDLRALNDRGDGSPEGELTTGILDQIARYERLKIAERSRRGKLRKAREGKVVAAKRPHYGYRYSASRDAYEVEEADMPTVARIFRMVGVEGAAIRGVKRVFEREGLPTPDGKRHRGQFFIREAIRDDIYKPHTRDEMEALVAKGQMSADVAARLDPDKLYGIWWFNRRKTRTFQVAVNGAGGKQYKRRTTITQRPEDEWIAVPVPESGIPRELSGGIARCGECDWAMRAHTSRSGKSGHTNHYYYCSRVNVNYSYKACANLKSHRADRVEPLVWDYVYAMMTNPDKLRSDLDAMIELERQGTRGNPGKEAKLWAEKLSEVERKRGRYQKMAAADLISFEELRTKLAELEETRKTAERELAALRDREERILQLERDRDTILDGMEATAPEKLHSLTPEQRHHWYKMLGLRVDVVKDGTLEISWAGDPRGESVCKDATLSLRVALLG